MIAPKPPDSGSGAGQSASRRRSQATIVNSRSGYWSAKVTRESSALALEEGVFTWNDPKAIALSLMRSALASRRRKGTPFQSAMSMLNLYINRAGTNLPVPRKRILAQAKLELRGLFHRRVTSRL
ncbi:MAG: DUF3175 domain-containing protein [Caulobacterales bacterium]